MKTASQTIKEQTIKEFGAQVAHAAHTLVGMHLKSVEMIAEKTGLDGGSLHVATLFILAKTHENTDKILFENN